MKPHHHVDLSRCAARQYFDAPIVDRIAEAAALPDTMDDIVAGSFGTSVRGARTCCLTHFCVEHGNKWRGYNWHMDKSICWLLRKIDPRTGNVSAMEEKWEGIVGKRACLSHPVRDLVAAPQGGRINLDMDNFTWPTAAVMAGWVWNARNDDGADLIKIIGCVLHWMQDACVPHHALGWLLRGHAKLEQRAMEQWFRDYSWALDRLVLDDVPIDPVDGPRRIVERIARGTATLWGANVRDASRISPRAMLFSQEFLRRVSERPDLKERLR